MTDRIKYLLVIIIISISFSKNSAQQLWLEYGIGHDFGEKFKAGIEFQNRYLDLGGLTNIMNSTEVNMSFRISPGFKIGGSYRYSYLKEKNGEPLHIDFEDKQRFCIDLNYKYDISKHYSLKNRARFQTSLENREDIKRYFRDKLTLEIEVDKRTEVLFSDEIFINLEKNKPKLNRISVGIKHNLFNNFYLEPCFHIELKNKHGFLHRDYILSTALFFRL
jgi:hypothetical protein